MPTSIEELILVLTQATAVLGVSALLVRGLIWLLRPASPTVERIAWLLVLVQGIVLVRLPIHVPWYEPEPAGMPIARPAMVHPTPADPSPPVLEPAIEPAEVSLAGVAASEGRAEPARDALAGPGRGDAPVAPSAICPLPTAYCLLLVWVAGMLLVPAYGLLKYLRFLRRIRGADFGEDAWTAQWRRLLAARGVRSPIPLRVTRDAGPALCLLPSGKKGTGPICAKHPPGRSGKLDLSPFSPGYAVLVPADVWRGLSAGQRDGVLRHELAHYERGDLWKSLLVRLLALPHWFNPLAWWAVRKFDECTEWLCDDAAVAKRPDVYDFAQALVQLGTLGSPQASALNSARGGRLFHRIRRLVAAKPSEDSKMKKTLLLAGTLALLLLGAFRIQLVAKEQPEARGATTPAQPPQDPKPASQAPAGPAVATRAAGTGQTERSIAAALAWLARHQAPDGSWSLQGYRKTCKDQSCTGPGSVAADAGATAMALLPFLAAGQTHQGKGPYQQTIWKGLYWLMQHQKADGDLSAGARGGPMYAHGLATIALCEAHGMSKQGDRQLGEKAQRAVNFILAAQNATTGGWRYNPGDDGDTSVLGWQVMALKSAQMAGLNVDLKAFDGARRFLRSCATGQHGGQFSYRPNQKATPSMTAVGLLCCQDLGIKRGDPSIVEGTAVLMANMPDKTQNPRDFYYWFFATQVMHNVSGPDWDKWNRQLRQALIDLQCKEDCAAGSWDPEKPTLLTWSQPGGRVMATSLAALTLDVYYRYLSSFKRDVEPAIDPRTGQPILLSAHAKVVDKQGKPVAGATVYLREWSTYRISTESCNQHLNDILATTQSDSQGAFRFENVPAKPLPDQWLREIPWDVVVVAKPYALAWQHLADAQQPNPLTISLVPEAKITGQVTDRQGRPIQGAEVTVHSISSLASDWREPITDPETLDLQSSRVAPAAKTDADGNTTITGLPRDVRLSVRLTHDDFRTEFVYVATTDQPQPEIELPDSSDGKVSRRLNKVHPMTFSVALGPALPRLVGRVTAADTRKPLPQAKVQPLRDLGTATDQDGRFILKEIRESRCRLSVWAPMGSDYVGRLLLLDVPREKKEVPVEVELARGEILSGVVADEDTGKGVAGASVMFDTGIGFDLDKIPAGALVPTGDRTDREGRFRLAVPPGKGKVRIVGTVWGYDLPHPGSLIGEPKPEFVKEVEVIAGKPTPDVKFTVRRVAGADVKREDRGSWERRKKDPPRAANPPTGY